LVNSPSFVPPTTREPGPAPMKLMFFRSIPPASVARKPKLSPALMTGRLGPTPMKLTGLLAVPASCAVSWMPPVGALNVPER
jgi:hypothetical protein